MLQEKPSLTAVLTCLLLFLLCLLDLVAKCLALQPPGKHTPLSILRALAWGWWPSEAQHIPSSWEHLSILSFFFLSFLPSTVPSNLPTNKERKTWGDLWCRVQG